MTVSVGYSLLSNSDVALTSSFLAAMCRAESLSFPLASFSSKMATTLSLPCCSATAMGVKPSCVVWCGVVWCGVVWCGVVWCGVVWCGVVWCGVVWCGVVWCGVVWRGVVC